MAEDDDITLAFVTSAQPWFRRWTRHIADHGPGRVVAVVAEQQSAFADPWRVLVADTNSSVIDRSFVDLVHQRGRGVIAVWDPALPAGKQKALDAGADGLIEADAGPAEFVRVLRATAVDFPTVPASRSRRRPVATTATARTGGLLVAVGGPVGAEPERVALGIMRALGSRHESAVLVDANEVAPSVAQRLGLTPVPNLAAAAARPTVTVAELDQYLQPYDGLFWVLAGLATPAQWSEVSPRMARSIVSALASRYDRAVVVLGPVLEDLAPYGTERYGISRAMLREADAVVAVVAPTPLGLALLGTWLADARTAAPRVPYRVVVLDAPRDRFRRAEISEYLAGLDVDGVHLMPPDDRRRQRADWNGELVRTGPLARELVRLTDVLAPKGARRG